MTLHIVQRFGRNVAAARAWADLTQKQLAEELDLDPSYVSLLEAGKRVPDIVLADRFAYVLGVSLADLLTGKPFAPRSP